MESPDLSCLDGLTNIGFGGGADMRPTLIRVLTDLYVQKLGHTADEERHYTELALRLLEGVDAATRAAVATRLARHLSPPARIVQYLVNDLPEVAAPLRAHPQLRPPQPAGTTVAQPPIAADTAAPPRSAAPAAEAAADPPAINPFAIDPFAIDPATAAELNEQFFAADEYERRLILLNLHVVAPIPAGRVALARDPLVIGRLEQAALGRNRDGFAQDLAAALRIPHRQAQRIARDSLGEPITVASKALAVPRDVVYRLLMFVNPAVGQSVARVHALATLYDEMTVPAAEGMVAIWQTLHQDDRAAVEHRPLLWNDETRAQLRVEAVARRTAAVPRANERRDAS
jgi:hypothetical protein